MKRSAWLVAALSMATLTATIAADEQANQSTAGAGATSEADQRLERIKKLAGAWESEDQDGDGKADTQVYYRIISGGTAVAEFLMPGTDHEMVSMYHKDNETLVLTHYCALGNQPRMRARAGGDANQIIFEFSDGTNMKSRDEMHIDGLHLTFVDDDHVVAAWKAYANGKPAEHAPSFKLSRIKDPAAAAKVAQQVAAPSKSLTPHKADETR